VFSATRVRNARPPALVRRRHAGTNDCDRGQSERVRWRSLFGVIPDYWKQRRTIIGMKSPDTVPGQKKARQAKCDGIYIAATNEGAQTAVEASPQTEKWAWRGGVVCRTAARLSRAMSSMYATKIVSRGRPISAHGVTRVYWVAHTRGAERPPFGKAATMQVHQRWWAYKWAKHQERASLCPNCAMPGSGHHVVQKKTCTVRDAGI
jgi:hypothetical protein